jgi:hypothetical protein
LLADNDDTAIIPGVTFISGLRKLFLTVVNRVHLAGLLHFADKRTLHGMFDGGNLGVKKTVVCGALATIHGKKRFIAVGVSHSSGATAVELKASYVGELATIAKHKKYHPDVAVREGPDVTAADFNGGWTTDGAALKAAKMLVEERVRKLRPGLEQSDPKVFKELVDAGVDNCLHHVLHNALKAGEKAADEDRPWLPVEVTGKKKRKVLTQGRAIFAMMKATHIVKQFPDRASKTVALRARLKKAAAVAAPHTKRAKILNSLRPARQKSGRFGVSQGNCAFLFLIVADFLAVLHATGKFNKLDTAINFEFRSSYRMARLRLSTFAHFRIYIVAREVIKSNKMSTSASYKCASAIPFVAPCCARVFFFLCICPPFTSFCSLLPPHTLFFSPSWALCFAHAAPALVCSRLSLAHNCRLHAAFIRSTHRAPSAQEIGCVSRWDGIRPPESGVAAACSKRGGFCHTLDVPSGRPQVRGHGACPHGPVRAQRQVQPLPA